MKKRIALVVVAALAGGVLAATPASATGRASGNGIIYTWYADGVTAGADGTYDASGFGLATASGVAGTANSVSLKVVADAGNQAADTTTAVGGTGTKRALITITGSTMSSSSTGFTANTAGTQIVVAADNAEGFVSVLTPTAGAAITVSLYKETAANSGIYSTTATESVVISVNAAASSGVLSVADSTSYIDEGNWSSSTSDDTVVAAKGTSPAVVATVQLALKDTLKAALKGKTVTATVSGPGLVYAPSTAGVVGSSNPVRAASVTLDSVTSTSYWAILNDGTAGKSTITFSVGTTTVSTETLEFYGTAASLVATVEKKYVDGATGGSTTGAISVIAKDANGVFVPQQGLTITSSNTDIIAGFTATSSTQAELDAETATVDINPVDGKYGEVTLTIALTSDSTVKTTAVVVSSKVVATTVALSFDKASYAPGEKATLSVELKDADGKALADGTYTVFTSTGITLSQAVQGAPAASTDVTIAGGKKTYTVYMPLIAGPVTAAATSSADTDLVTAAQSKALSASTSVVIPASAAETANAAAIATLNTAVATLQTTVASLVASMTAQIKVINAALVKIAKKLKVKI